MRIRQKFWKLASSKASGSRCGAECAGCGSGSKSSILCGTTKASVGCSAKSSSGSSKIAYEDMFKEEKR